MPVVLFFRDSKTFPTGKEVKLLDEIYFRIKKRLGSMVLSWTIIELGEASRSFHNIHFELSWSFHGENPFTLSKLATDIAGHVGYFANNHAPKVDNIEVRLTNLVDGRIYEASLQRQWNPGNPDGHKTFHPEPRKG